jgi:hypothetical protein
MLIKNYFEIMLQYCETGGYMRRFTSSKHGAEFIWSLHYWTHRSEKDQGFLEKRSEPGLNRIRDTTRFIN